MDKAGAMKIVILLIYLLLVTPAFAFEPDKVSHFGTSAGYGLVLGTATYHLATEMGPVQRLATSTGLALVPGVIIEIVNEFQPRNEFNADDLLADALGAISGAVAAELINGQLWVSASGNQIRLIGHW